MASKGKATPSPSIVPPVTVELGGVTRKLRCDFTALMTLERELGIEALDVPKLVELFETKSATTQTVILRALLLHESPEITVGELAAMRTLETGPQVASAIAEAFWQSIGAPTSDDEATTEDPSGEAVAAGA